MNAGSPSQRWRVYIPHQATDGSTVLFTAVTLVAEYKRPSAAWDGRLLLRSKHDYKLAAVTVVSCPPIRTGDCARGVAHGTGLIRIRIDPRIGRRAADASGRRKRPGGIAMW